ncbi:MAG TPA: hypothetical protein VJ385_05375 [Fibrobacteria bacterium]|nr:hypothetical protein [Fibrobacteria bacterium]
MGLSEEEKDLVAQALQLYLQQASMQLPQASVNQLVTIAKGIITKLDQLETGGGKSKANQPPAGISEEWFENVCRTCAHLSATGCTDKITVKFPGKCDPILKYERSKAGVR